MAEPGRERPAGARDATVGAVGAPRPAHDAAARDPAAGDAAGAVGPPGPAEPLRRGSPRRADAPPVYRWRGLPFRARLVAGLVVAAVVPVAAFGLVALAAFEGAGAYDAALGRTLVLVVAAAVVLGVAIAASLAAALGGPLRAISDAVERAAAGDPSALVELPADDELGRLAETYGRLAGDLERRNRELRSLVDELSSLRLPAAPRALAARAGEIAVGVFGMVDGAVLLVDPREIPVEEAVPGEHVPVRATLVSGGTEFGVVTGHLPATRRWAPADQDLLELFASEVAALVRTAELYSRIEDQNRRLLTVDEAKDDFLRGVSHNLQTPLASIRAYAEQVAAEAPDRRLGIIVEQTERLSRMVRQLLITSRLETGALRPRQEVFAIAPRIRRTWEALGAGEVPFALRDAAPAWLALGDPDHVDQVLWALLDNALVHGRRTPLSADVAIDEGSSTLAVMVADRGPGIPIEERELLFRRYARASGSASGTRGSGLGLYVARELCRAMGGDLLLEPAGAGGGATFTILLPAETAEAP